MSVTAEIAPHGLDVPRVGEDHAQVAGCIHWHTEKHLHGLAAFHSDFDDLGLCEVDRGGKHQLSVPVFGRLVFGVLPICWLNGAGGLGEPFREANLEVVEVHDRGILIECRVVKSQSLV